MSSHRQLVEEYLSLLEKFDVEEKSFSHIFHPEFSQQEFPNALNKNGQQSSYAELFKRMSIGKTIISYQKYGIKSFIEQGERAVVESSWEGKMAIDAGPLKKDQVLKAHFCMTFEFKEGKLFRQNNYDCFEPF